MMPFGHSEVVAYITCLLIFVSISQVIGWEDWDFLHQSRDCSGKVDYELLMKCW